MRKHVVYLVPGTGESILFESPGNYRMPETTNISAVLNKPPGITILEETTLLSRWLGFARVGSTLIVYANWSRWRRSAHAGKLPQRMCPHKIMLFQ